MNTNKPAERKPYFAPTLTKHGGAVEQTRGPFWHAYYEYWGYRNWVDYR